MTDPQLWMQAQQGDAIAITALLNQSLHAQGIWARVEPSEADLCIVLESTQAPPAELMERRITSGLQKLQPRGITHVTLRGFALGDTHPLWERQVYVSRDGATPAPASPSPHARNPAAESRYPATTVPLVSEAADAQGASAQPRRRSPSRPQSRDRQSRRAPQPFVLKWSDFDPMMLAIIGFVAVYGFFGARNPGYDGPFIWLHYPDLAIHETGHLLFLPFGHFLTVLGGSLTQIAFPAVFTGYFFYSRQYFSSALTLFWTGQNFMDVAVYMADAPYRALPLTTPNIDAHDWWQLFNLMNCMRHAGLIAGITHWIGVLLYVAAVIAGVYVAYRHQQEMNEISRSRAAE